MQHPGPNSLPKPTWPVSRPGRSRCSKRVLPRQATLSGRREMESVQGPPNERSLLAVSHWMTHFSDHTFLWHFQGQADPPLVPISRLVRAWAGRWDERLPGYVRSCLAEHPVSIERYILVPAPENRSPFLGNGGWGSGVLEPPLCF